MNTWLSKNPEEFEEGTMVEKEERLVCNKLNDLLKMVSTRQYPHDLLKLCTLLDMAIYGRFTELNRTWSIWKTKKLVTGNKNADFYVKELRKNACHFLPRGETILYSPYWPKSIENLFLRLIKLKVKDLGLREGGTLKDIFERGRCFGLGLCPPELGPELRIGYLDQVKGESLLIAMEAIIDTGNNPGYFQLENRNNGISLDLVSLDLDSVLDAEQEIVFVQV